MNDFDLLPGTLHRGLGIVARWPGVILMVPSDPAHDAAVEDFIAGLGAEPPPGEVAREVRARAEAGTLRAVGLLLAATGGPLALVQGAVEVVADGETVLSGVGGLAERQVLANDRVVLRAANLAKAAEGVRPFDLRRGVVPGAGLTLGVRVSAILVSPPEAPAAPRRPDIDQVGGPPPEPDPPQFDVPFRSELLLGDPHAGRTSEAATDPDAASGRPARAPGSTPGTTAAPASCTGTACV